MQSRALTVLCALAALLPASAAAADVRFAARDEPLAAPLRALAGLDRVLAPRQAPFRFNLAGLHWRGSGRVWFRTRGAGERFGPWLEAAPEAEDLPDRESAEAAGAAGWRLGNPYWTGSARFIQYRLDGRVTALRAFFVWSAPGRPSRRLVAAGLPEIIPRSAWGADESIVRAAPSYAPRLRLAVVHHTAGRNDYGPEDSAAIVRGIEVYHVKANGWNDIGYNFLVDRYGQVFEGRGGGVDRSVVGAHALGFNTGSVGVAVLGSYGDEAVSPEAEGKLEALLAWRLDLAHVDPVSFVEATSGGNERFRNGTPVTLRAVSGHRDTGATECPGDSLYAELDAIAAATQPLGLPKLYEPVAEPSRLTVGTDGAYEPIRLTARLSAPLPWRVVVADATGAEVASGSGSGETVDWTWSGSGADGRPVDPDGTYTATIAAADALPAELVLAGAPPGFDVIGLAVAPPALSPDGDGVADEARVSFRLTDAAQVRVRVEDEAGGKVATIAPERVLPSGPAEIVWNGARRDGTPVPDGRYRVAVVARRDGVTIVRSASVVVDRTLAALAVSPGHLSPNGDGRQDALAVSFVLARDADVRVFVRHGSSRVATVFAGSLPAGPQTVSWDGRLRRGPAADGTYVAVVEATTELGTRRLGSGFDLDTTRPVLSLISASSRRGTTRLRFALSEPARVKIWTDAGAIAIDRGAGKASFSVDAPTTRVRLVAWDPAGNASKPVRVSVGR